MCKTPGCQHLFKTLKFEKHNDRRSGGDSVIRQIQKIRREELPTGPIPREILEAIDTAIDRIRYLSRASDEQIEGLILYAIEIEGASFAGEIGEVLGITDKIVKPFLASMESKGMIYQVKKYIPGSDRPYKTYKSARLNIPECNGNVIKMPESNWCKRTAREMAA